MVGTDSTAILIFTRTAAAEAAAKPLSGRFGAKVNRDLAEALIFHTHQEAVKTGLPVFTSFSSEQVGSHFGERLVNAFQDLFAQGFQRVISIGNDCPDLKSDTIVQAATSLEQHDLVLGPATDGGLYLLGINRATFDTEAIADLPWETARLQEGIADWAQQKSLCPEWLAAESDIDSAEELKRYLKQDHTPNRIGRILKRILTPELPQRPYETPIIPFSLSLQQYSRRGPPL